MDAATLILLCDLRREFDALPIEEQIEQLWNGSADLRATYRGQKASFAALYRMNVARTAKERPTRAAS